MQEQKKMQEFFLSHRDGSFWPVSYTHLNDLYIGQNITNEYIRTKFLAERAVLEAVSSGLDGKVIRVGNLMSRNSDGEFQINFITNGFLRSLRGYEAVGKFPIGAMHEVTEFSPIDSTALAVLRLVQTCLLYTSRLYAGIWKYHCILPLVQKVLPCRSQLQNSSLCVLWF